MTKPAHVLFLSPDTLCPQQLTSTLQDLAQGRVPEAKVHLPHSQLSLRPMWAVTCLRPEEERGTGKGQGSVDKPTGLGSGQQAPGP